MKFLKRHSLRAGVAKQEYSESHFIPYFCHWDSNSIITKNNELITVIRLDGFSFETADDEDLDIKKNIRNTLLKGVASDQFALWFHMVRRKKKAYLKGQYDDAFCQYISDCWAEKHSDSVSFVNELFITIVRKAPSQKVAKFEDFINKFFQVGESEEGWGTQMRNGHKDTMEVTRRLMGSMQDYKPKLLGLRQTEKGTFSELLEFFGTLVNGGEFSPMLLPNTDASKYLPLSRLYFGRRAIELRNASGKRKFSAGLSIREYAPYTSAGMLDAFLQLPFELVISQSYVISDRQDAISQMSLHQRRMTSGGDKGISQADELTDAMDLAMGGHIGFGKHHMSIFAFEDDLKALEKSMSQCYAELVNVGITPSRELLNLQALYWAQLPANFSFIARGSVINSMNLSGFCSLHNYPTGKKNRNHWGEAVTLFDTTSGTPYFFNFHVRDVGHTTIIGPTGAGKTVLMNFLVAQSQKYSPRIFFFDKDRGAEIFIRAMGGVYTIIEPGKRANFNPLQLEDTDENRSFLADWLRAMALSSQSGGTVTAQEDEWIDEAVAGNFKLPKSDRILHNIAPFLGLEEPGSLAARMRRWHGDGSHHRLFDNDADKLDFSTNRVFAFEMGKVLQDGISLGPVLLYLFHKIQMSLDGSPTIIVLDEAWALIDNEVFGPKIKDWLKVLRKLNAMVVFATQSVEDVSKSAISDTLVQQTATQVFLPNPRATEEYKKTFMLTDREFALIKTTDPGSRFFLVKQVDETVIARIDLSGMEDAISVLSGRAETVSLLDTIRSEVGDDPQKWMPIFLDKVQENEKKKESE